MRKFTFNKREREIATNLNRLLFSAGLGLVLAGQALPAQQSEADRHALAQLRAQSEKGDAQAQSKLADAYFLGNLGLAKNEVESVKWLCKAGEQNLASAQFKLGLCLAYGRGAAQDLVEAYAWCRLSARGVEPPTNLLDDVAKATSPEQIAAAYWRTKELRAQIEARLKSSGK